MSQSVTLLLERGYELKGITQPVYVKRFTDKKSALCMFTESEVNSMSHDDFLKILEKRESFNKKFAAGYYH